MSMMRRPTEKRCMLWHSGARKTTSHSTSAKLRSLRWIVLKAQQRLIFLRRLRKFGMSPHILHSFYTCTKESILTGCITAWYGNGTSSSRQALQRDVRTACHTVGGELPSLQDIYTRRCMRKGQRITSHPSHGLFSLLPSGRRIRSIRSRTSWLKGGFFTRLSGCWIQSIRTDTHTVHFCVHTIHHNTLPTSVYQPLLCVHLYCLHTLIYCFI